MSTSAEGPRRLGWIGAGRMGFELARRLLDAGFDLAVWNRTRAKAEPLADLGAKLVNAPVELADRQAVFTMVSGSCDCKTESLGFFQCETNSKYISAELGAFNIRANFSRSSAALC